MKRLPTMVSAGLAALTLLAGAATPQAAKAWEGPDLVIRSANLYSTGVCNYLQPAIVGYVTVKNRGSVRSKALWVSPFVRVWDDENQKFQDTEVRINSLAPGETQRVRVRIGSFERKSGYVGWRKIRIHADPLGRIRETNELNNSYHVNVRAHCA